LKNKVYYKELYNVSPFIGAVTTTFWEF